MNNKNTLSKIFGFIAMGFAIISIPMFFLSVMKFGVGMLSVGENLIGLFKAADLAASFGAGVAKAVPICCIVSMVFALIGAVLSAIPNKGTKIGGCCTNCVAFVLSTVLLILIFAKGEGLAKPGIGLWINVVALLIAAVFSILAAVMAPKKNKSEFIDGDMQWGGVPIDPTPVMSAASAGITFLSGSCAGYQIPINSGAEIIIGKDPAQCSIVIDKKYEKVSRKHCGVRFDAMQNIYIVTDYSSNGTMIVGGSRLARGSASYLDRGTTINLAKTENSFRLD